MSRLRLSFSCSARKRISPRGSAPAFLNAVEQGHRGHPSARVCAHSRGNPRLFAAGGDHLAAQLSCGLLPFAHRRTAPITNGVLSKKVFPAGTGRQSGSRDELFNPCAWEGNAPRFSQRGGSSFSNTIHLLRSMCNAINDDVRGCGGRTLQFALAEVAALRPDSG
jgi:hypothetical protein